MSLLFFLMIFSTLDTDFETYKTAVFDAGVPALALFLAACAASLLIARGIGLERRERIAMVFEVGVQTAAAAFLLAVNLQEDMARVPPSYS